MRFEMIKKMVLTNGLEVTENYLEETIALIASVNAPTEDENTGPLQEISAPEEERPQEPDLKTEVHERPALQGGETTGTGSGDALIGRSEPGESRADDFVHQLTNGSTISFRE